MQSANLSGPLKGLRPYQALIGPTQASGLAGGFDSMAAINILLIVINCFCVLLLQLLIPKAPGETVGKSRMVNILVWILGNDVV